MKYLILLTISTAIISCRPKVADKATADEFQRSIFLIIESFTNETTKLYNDTGEALKSVEISGGRMSSDDSVKVFTQYHKWDSTTNITLNKLSAVNETEEILNFDKGQLKKLTTDYVLETKKQINGPLLSLIQLHTSLKRDSSFDSLEIKYAEDYGKKKEFIDGITTSILQLPYYQEN